MDITLPESHTFEHDEDRNIDDFNAEQYSLEEWFMLTEYFDKGSVQVTVCGDTAVFNIHQMGVNVKSTQMSLPMGSLDLSQSEAKPHFSRKPRVLRQDK